MIVSQTVSTQCLMLILKARKRTLRGHFWKKKKTSQHRRSSFFLWEASWRSCSAVVIVWQCWWEDHRRQNTAWVIGSSYFFHIWVGVKEGGEEGKQRAQVGGICTDYWWLLATGADWQQEMGVYAGKLHLHQNNYKALHLRRGGS